MIDKNNLSILVVDDMKSMRLTIRKMLKNLDIGKILRFAENGREGLDVLKSTKCDLVFMDWNMPVLNGVEMLERMRSDKELRDIPVIMVTAEAERDIVAEVAETEVDGYLLKPLTLGALDTTIKSVIERVNNPEPATVHRLKARELEEQGDFEAAIEQVKIALSHKPSASRLLRMLGLLHFRIKKNKIAEKCLHKAISVNRNDVISRVYLADYHIKKDDLEKAGNLMLEILSLSSRYNERALDLGDKLLTRGSRRLAMDLFSKTISRSQKANAVREKVIDLCLEKNEVEFPKALLEQSIKENPSNYDMIFKTGLVSLKAEDNEAALKYFTEVDRHVRGHIEAKLELAKLYLRDQKVLQADEYLTQILRIEPKNEMALALRRET